MSDEAMVGPWWPSGATTTIGSWPGTEPLETARIVAGETPMFPALPELPARGAGADMAGRTLALLPELHVEVVPTGWRFTSSAGPDERRADSWVRQDLDAFEEAAYDLAVPVKVQLVGPLTLAASVELASGERSLSDHGARADVAAALAEAAANHVTEIRRRLSRATQIVLQLDEPAVVSVLGGRVPTASGYRTYRSVDIAEAIRAWSGVVDAVHAVGGRVAIHSCATDVPFAQFALSGFDALSFDLATIRIADYDVLGEAIDAGTAMFIGCVPTDQPSRLDAPTAARTLTDSLQRWWRDLGFAPAELADRAVLTPACGLAGHSPQQARRAIALLQDIVGAVVEDPEGDHARE